jgi:hypothetical protein
MRRMRGGKTVDGGRRTVGGGRRTVDGVRWALDGGRWRRVADSCMPRTTTARCSSPLWHQARASDFVTAALDHKVAETIHFRNRVIESRAVGVVESPVRDAQSGRTSSMRTRFEGGARLPRGVPGMSRAARGRGHGGTERNGRFKHERCGGGACTVGRDVSRCGVRGRDVSARPCGGRSANENAWRYRRRRSIM